MTPVAKRTYIFHSENFIIRLIILSVFGGVFVANSFCKCFGCQRQLINFKSSFIFEIHAYRCKVRKTEERSISPFYPLRSQRFQVPTTRVAQKLIILVSALGCATKALILYFLFELKGFDWSGTL